LGVGERIELTDGERQKVRQALEHIERAHRLVLSAAEQLDSVPGLAGEWEATVGLYEAIKAHWYAVEQRRASLAGDVPGAP
jgi:hypothetical protein